MVLESVKNWGSLKSIGWSGIDGGNNGEMVEKGGVRMFSSWGVVWAGGDTVSAGSTFGG
jgi:hypothetical protein